MQQLATSYRFNAPLESSRFEIAGDGEFSSISRPVPLIRQKISSKVRRARVLGSSLRVSVLTVHDIVLVLTLHVATGQLRQFLRPFPTFAEMLSDLAPKGIFPRLELLSAVIIGLAVLGNYRSGRYRYNARALFGGAALGLSLVAWRDLWYAFSPERLVGYSLAVLGLGVALVVGRKVVDVLVARFYSDKAVASRALVVGTADPARKAAAAFGRGSGANMSVMGFLDVSPFPADDALGGMSDVLSVIDEQQIDTIIFAEILDENLMGDLLEVADEMGCAALVGWYQFPFRGFVPALVRKRHVPLVALTRPSLLAHQLVAKRVFDFVVALLMLVAAAPLFLLIAIAIRLDSKGPVFFGATRIGFGGKQFRMMKFRSMVSDADSRRAALAANSVYADGRLFKVVGDPRITRVGRFLRRSSLDELPQLWNVLLGEMSLVGPRPPLPDEVVRYEEYHYDRFGMKPGITGPWQVGGRNSIRDFETVVQMEVDYINDWSIGRDLDILFRTIPAVASMSGV
jgi:exopolysaccharide biosynthesis polyprenyl glycosylphosphotransferase